MDESSMIERLRLDADEIETDGTDVDALVGGALVQGRRRRTRRRAGAALGAVVAAAVLVTVVVGGGLPTRLGSPQPDPVGTPVIATPVPGPTVSTTTPPASPSPTRPGTTGVVDASPGDVRTVAAGLLPDSLTVTASSVERAEGSDGFPWEYIAALTVKDARGTSYLFVNVGNGSFGDGCMNLKDCTTTTLPDGGIIWVTESPAGDKAGADRTYAYDRADGAHLSLMQRNYAAGNGPVTRTGLPLTDKEAKALLTSTAWDRLFQG
jgi:hypothetical protein